ncbi:segregation/condensation protein A [Candidatus Saccharibacteria bacterium]|nr:segregation/condensation protein A [Candidatus Saccharibacteria bacterium]NIV03393.1 segregation/condensation protein A [Calditrichia bacterium]NIS37937.1 segregation/condensation protein A [Candidatus Saccharibacteria bacterium]NIV71599.1 segregation/condensation protein A [Calditrichia bacterium]NIV98217.1 segregation/condensation protein A [Candidatus Saccharibacteria bacterium]
MYQRVLKRLEPFIALPKEALQKTVSIAEKIDQIRSMITRQAKSKFSEVLKSAKNKTEVIVSFLALLELTKQHIVETSQEKLFEDITIEKLDV